MTTELEMKEALDGWFYVYNCEKQAVMRRKVPKDHIPSHKPKIMEEDQKPKTGYAWTQREDEMLLELRHRNHSWRECAKYLRMSSTCARNRYLELCRKRGLREHRYERPLENREMEARVMALRGDGKTFQDIAEILTITRNQVAGIVQRVRRRMDQLEYAA